jgi:hypothetical protein
MEDEYCIEDAISIRKELIKERDKCLGPDKFDATLSVLLSHTIALLAQIIANPEKEDEK